MKLELQVIKLNEDVIATSLCEFYTLRTGLKISGHMYCAKAGDKGISYYYDPIHQTLIKEDAIGQVLPETGWYHFDTDIKAFVKCSVGDEGHPHIDQKPE